MFYIYIYIFLLSLVISNIANEPLVTSQMRKKKNRL